ncbi:hypothetical protein DUNSADRAFT_2166 [Dunaliella salina]|uniref:Uncharacterized protein n=1 Tax=Dunaliella salina TaxID=3046 RepID=A0ABQ7H8E5_DUNSA|nr:hypothetical protein DUNSADRAFT_2166 [Dunaliella salina]|eukprot:KAF5843129.1 hypothetical protein DUNSADRAFT_2166 [Dunaliella salina]
MCANCRSRAASDACLSMASANPMQEPSGLSGLGRVHSAGDGAEGRSPEDMELDAYTSGYDALEDGSRSEWDNPMLTPPETAPPTAEVSRASLLSLVQDLHESTPVREGTPAPPRPAKTASQPSPTPAAEDGGNKAEEKEEPDGDLVLEQEASRARLQEVEEQQQQRRNDLGGYILTLKDKMGDDGKPLVELPSNYLAMVESLLVARRHEYAALDGWLGPTRFQNLPINQLPDRHEDPRVEAGLARIKALDAKLADKETEAMIMIREADPERWAAQERVRLEKKARAVEETLK